MWNKALSTYYKDSKEAGIKCRSSNTDLWEALYQFSFDICVLLPIYISVRKNSYTPKDYKNTKPIKQEKKEQIILTEESIKLHI